MKMRYNKFIIALMLLGINCGVAFGQSPDQNYVRTTVPRQPVKTNYSLDSLVLNKDAVNITINYVDGLGRPLQTVQQQGSPLGKDIIQPVVYDQYGRPSTTYLPYVENSGIYARYRTNATAAQALFYNPAGSSGSQQANGVVRTTAPYAVSKYELSPLARPLEQGAPGVPWQPNATRTATSASGHTVLTEYTGNTDQTGIRKVRLYQATNPSNNHTRRLINAGWYAAKKLGVTISKDENWVSTNLKAGTNEEYQNNTGQVVLKRVWLTDTNDLTTYYVYDDFGNLCFVIPPGAADATTGNVSQLQLDNLCYQYRYDERNRVIEKKLPGKGWDYIVYNKLDQVVATQDSVQRMKTPLQQASFIKYDAIGRVAVTGVFNIAGSSTAGTNYRTTILNAVNVQTKNWETRLYVGTANTTDYSANAYPATDFTQLTINYYDKYTAIPGKPSYYVPVVYTLRTQGLLTATRIAMLNTPANTLLTVNYYDVEGRLSDIYAQHYKKNEYNVKNYDATTFTYNFNDQVTTTTRKHYIYLSTQANPQRMLTIAKRNIYDHQGRKIKTWQQITNADGTNDLTPDTRTVLSKLDYNEVGQLRANNQHSTDSVAYLQTINNTYNERGWLSKITTNTNKLTVDLRYNDADAGIARQFNGNIAQQLYSGQYSGSKSFTYSYDKLNRLTNAALGTGTTLNEAITYDGRGNILTLNRGGQSYTTPLAYTYGSSGVSNQLATVAATGFTTRNYSYDGNGNATTDGGSLTIAYNLLNLPQTVKLSGTTKATYTYDASGQKLHATQTGNDRDYIGGIIYNNNAIEYIATEEGRATPNGATAYNYSYDLKDQLGNVRATVDKDPTGGTARVVQEDEYYAFGLRVNKYDFSNGNLNLYNGKELQTDLANQYDYGARFYDPVVARWNVIDRYAEKYEKWSPYSYGMNNPIKNIDIGGDSIIVSQSGNNYNVRLTGKIINDSSTPFTSDQLNSGVNRASSAIGKYFSVSDGNATSTGEASLSVASNDNPLQPGDHAIRVVDPGAMPDGFGGKMPTNTVGETNMGLNVIYVSSAIFNNDAAKSGENSAKGLTTTGGATFGRTVGHELLHNAGVTAGGKDHPKPGENPGNLLNPSGSKDAGTNVTIDQIKQMKTNYDNGQLNHGKQKLL